MEKAVLSEPKACCATSSLVLVPRGPKRTDQGRRLAAHLISDEPRQQQLVLRGVHPDLIELAPPPGREMIGIDWVRKVIRQGQFTPTQGKRKVCVITRAEALTIEASNALLKVLEEPPRNLVFLLLAAHTGDILPTILSRSRVVRISPPLQKDLLARLVAAGYLEEEGKYLMAVARGEEELEPFLRTKEDLAAAQSQAREMALEAASESLVAILTADDPILRHEGVLVLLDRLIDGEAELVVAGARILAQAGKGKVAALLEDLRTIAFDVVRVGLSLSMCYQHAALSTLVERVNPDQILEFCTSIERAQRAVEGYVPLEPVLLSLFLGVRRLRDD